MTLFFTHLTLILLLHYLVKWQNGTLTVYKSVGLLKIDFILGTIKWKKDHLKLEREKQIARTLRE